MILLMRKWRVQSPHDVLAFSGENGTEILTIVPDKIEDYTYSVDFKNGGVTGVIPLGKGMWDDRQALLVTLTSGQIGPAGPAEMQVIGRNSNGDLVKKSNIFSVTVGESINAAKEFSEMPASAFEQYVTKAGESADSAKASAEAAAESEKSAKASETASSESEKNAKASEEASAASEKASAESERVSTENADIAVSSAEAAKASETAAAESEKNAKASEEAASASEEASTASEVNAKASETAASASERNADASEKSAASSAGRAMAAADNAETSRTKAAASEKAAKESETNSALSEANAKSSEEHVESMTGETTTMYEALMEYGLSVEDGKLCVTYEEE